MSHLGKTVHYYQDGIVAFTGWESDDEIAGEVRPGALGNGKRLQKSVVLVVAGLGSFARVAVSNVLADVTLHALPVVSVSDEF